MVEWFPSALPPVGVMLGKPLFLQRQKAGLACLGGGRGQRGVSAATACMWRWRWESVVMVLCYDISGELCGAGDVVICLLAYS